MDANLILAAVSVVLFLGLVGFFAFLIRHQEQVEPEVEPPYGVELLRQHYGPGETVEQPTPYFVAPIPASPDPLEISANLDKKILLGAATIFLVFASVGGYFVIQGGLRAEAAEHQLSLDVRRGQHVYESLCYDCHGRDGRGGQTPEGETLPGLPLNQPANKHELLQEDPAALAERRQVLERTIERGRDRPPGLHDMPAWARSEGGQLSPWQVKQLVDFIMHGTDADWEHVAALRAQHAEGGVVAEQIPPPPALPTGRELAQAYCTTCHSLDANRPSPNPLSPNFAEYIAQGATPRNDPLRALAATDPDWLFKWISNPPAIKPDTQMPSQHVANGGPLTDEGIRLLVEYLEGGE
ncbi:MAG: c-type cytochrome [Candidatus Limnocylindria bacterium]